MAPNFYEVLGIKTSASQEEVRRAYRKKALETHPDKIASQTIEEVKESAAAKFRDVHEAFQVLNDPWQRRAYDIRIKPKSAVPTKLPDHLDKEQIARTKDREEWARQATQRRQERMSTLNEALRARDAPRKVQEERRSTDNVYHEVVDRFDSKMGSMVDKMSLVNRMLEDLYRLNPEWEMRKEQVRRRKADQGRARTARTRV